MISIANCNNICRNLLQSVIMNQIINPLFSTMPMLMLCWISLKPLPLDGGRTTDSFPNRSLQNSFEFLLEFEVLLKIFLETFCRLEINPLESSVAFHVETRHDLRCKPNDCFYVKYSNRLKYNNATPFLLNNQKCAKPILDVFSTENLSMHHKILIGLKGQFDLHKIL